MPTPYISIIAAAVAVFLILMGQYSGAATVFLLSQVLIQLMRINTNLEQQAQQSLSAKRSPFESSERGR